MIDATIPNPLKDELMENNKTFRDLFNEHQTYEKRLHELAGLTYPNEHEIQEETELKKKKLAIKDELQSILNDYSKSH